MLGGWTPTQYDNPQCGQCDPHSNDQGIIKETFFNPHNSTSHSIAQHAPIIITPKYYVSRQFENESFDEENTGLNHTDKIISL